MKERLNKCTLVIQDYGYGRVKVNMTFSKILRPKLLLTSAEQLAFDTLQFIKDQQEDDSLENIHGNNPS